jgi:hypothetical protein
VDSGTVLSGLQRIAESEDDDSDDDAVDDEAQTPSE